MGNYEKQAKIDIDRHPEWDEQKRTTHLYRMKVKDKMSNSTYRERRNELFELIEEYIDKTLCSSWQNKFVDIIDVQYGEKEKPYTRGLRSKQLEFITDEGVWWTNVDN